MDKEFIVEHLARNADKEYTLHELSKELDMPYTSFYRAIHALTPAIHLRTKGNSKLVRINFNEYSRACLVIASYKRKQRFLENHPIIAKITQETNEITLLFGSYAKNTYTERSDIDILVIGSGKVKRFDKQELLFKKRINVVSVTKKEFRDMLKLSEENLTKQALRNHVILNGHEQFWKEVQKAIG